jgi:hypothetical protein
MRRWRRRCVSHHTVLVRARTERMLAAQTADDFFRAEVPASRDGRPLWHCQPRAAVNLRQLLETDTVEFRHFPGTLEPQRLKDALYWAKMWLEMALEGDPDPVRHARRVWEGALRPIPFPDYVHWREVRYRATCHDGTVPRDQIATNIRAIQEGRFDAH